MARRAPVYAAPDPTGAPPLSVIVPATGEAPAPALPRCVAAIRAGLAPGDELLVERKLAGAGPAEARNAAARRARGEVLVFVDADVVIHGDALQRIREHMGAPGRIDAVFGAYDTDPGEPDPVSQFRNLLHHHVHATSPGPAETFWAGLGAVRREAFEAVGGFDEERFRFPSVEDIELGMRLRARGRSIVLDPALRGKHLKRWSLGSMVVTDLHRRGVPWLRLQLESGRAGGTLNLGWRQRFGALAVLLGALGLLRRQPIAGALALAALPLLNLRLYRLLARQGGPTLVAQGFALHLIHELTAITSVPAALVLHGVAVARDPAEAPSRRGG